MTSSEDYCLALTNLVISLANLKIPFHKLQTKKVQEKTELNLKIKADLDPRERDRERESSRVMIMPGK